MRVLIVFFGDDYHGGTTYSTFTIAQELVRRGHEVHAYARVTPAGVLARDLEACGVMVHDGRAAILVRPPHERRALLRPVRLGLEWARRLHTYPKSEREVERIIRDCDIDLVAISSGAISTGARAARRTGIPYVWHIREFMEEDHGLEHYPWAHAYERMEGAARLVCVSKAVEDKMRRVCPNARTAVVYNGIDQTVFNPEGRVGKDDGAPVRLMVSGGIRHSKGTFLALDALRQLGDDTPYTLDVYGNEGGGVGEGAKDLVALCEELGLADRVRYHGPVRNIADEYRAHDIQIVASRAEAYGRITAEAMLCGCAVVGSNSGGTPELLADGRGYLFEPNDATSLAQALAQAMRDPAGREATAARALDFARENLSVKAYVDKVEQLYLEAV
ncbi:MAG: glycosyltransferase family 4 protein [Atopobiaceae bacterium]|nr:glycosyltransferase family 4 protein [Atopobiaceae bacterium]